MDITADLKLTFPIRWAELPMQREPGESDAEWKVREGRTTLEPVVWAYHTPIGRAIFEANYRALSAANMTIFSKGTGFAAESGPIIATLALRDAARADALEAGLGISGDPATPLLAEIKRLTLVLAPSANGYEPVPVDVAIGRGAIDAEDWAGAESAIVFFTCGSWLVRREYRDLKRSALAAVLRGSITSSPVTAFAASLPTSTKLATSAPLIQSLVPS